MNGKRPFGLIVIITVMSLLLAADIFFLVLVYAGAINKELTLVEMWSSMFAIFLVSLTVYGIWSIKRVGWWACFICYPILVLWLTVEAYLDQADFSLELYIGIISLFYGFILKYLNKSSVREYFGIRSKQIFSTLVVNSLLGIGFFLILSFYIGLLFSFVVIAVGLHGIRKAKNQEIKLRGQTR